MALLSSVVISSSSSAPRSKASSSMTQLATSVDSFWSRGQAAVQRTFSDAWPVVPEKPWGKMGDFGENVGKMWGK
jgi:hypothetical protein